MAGATGSVEGVLADLPTPIIPKIGGELAREVIIDLHQLVSGNTASIVSNLGGGQNGHLALTITRKKCMADTSSVFVQHINQDINCQPHKAPKNKCSDLKSSDRIKRCSGNTPPSTEP